MIFDAIAFPWYLFGIDGNLIGTGPGSLFDLPASAASPTSLNWYSSLRTEGWRKCPQGYAVYCKRIASNQSSLGVEAFLILPGLKVRGVSTISGKSNGLTLFTEQQHMVSHLEAILEADRRLLDRFDAITRQNIHEIRGINTGLYHAAVELAAVLPLDPRLKKARELSVSIEALSQILSARIDFISYLNDESLSEVDFGLTQVYKRFDKMCRCFVPQAAKSGVDLSISGFSYGSTYGPRSMMELAAYLLLDNALKYSPPDQSIRVEIKDRDRFIEARVSSIGPKIHEHELGKIFQLDYRGEAAQRSGKSGSGIGLHALRKLVEQGFSGKARVEVGPHKIDIQGNPFHDIAFVLEFPLAKG